MSEMTIQPGKEDDSGNEMKSGYRTCQRDDNDNVRDDHLSEDKCDCSRNDNNGSENQRSGKAGTKDENYSPGCHVSEFEELKEQLINKTNKLNQELIQRQKLEVEVAFLRQLLTSSFHTEQLSILHRLKDQEILKNRIVFQAMMCVDLGDFSSEAYDEDVTADPETVLKDHSLLLESIASHAHPGGKILILVKDFPGPMFLYLSAMTSVRESEESSSSSSVNVPFSTSPHGCVIGKTTRADARVLMKKYAYLIDCGSIKINVFNDSSILSKGYPKAGPFDIILVPEMGWAEALKSQLKTNGIFFNPFERSVRLQKDWNGNLVSV